MMARIPIVHPDSRTGKIDSNAPEQGAGQPGRAV
jgi:hypothetical protein